MLEFLNHESLLYFINTCAGSYIIFISIPAPATMSTTIYLHLTIYLYLYFHTHPYSNYVSLNRSLAVRVVWP